MLQQNNFPQIRMTHYAILLLVARNSVLRLKYYITCDVFSKTYLSLLKINSSKWSVSPSHAVDLTSVEEVCCQGGTTS